MLDRKQSAISWIDVLWLLFIVGLAILPPIGEVHKQLTLLAIGIFQLLEGRLIAWQPDRGRVYSVLIKIVLSTLLLDHTGELGINSAYWPIYFLPIATAAIYFGPVSTLLWTGLASISYCFYLVPALQQGYELTWESGISILLIRILFFFLAAILMNRFVVENRRQVQRYQALSVTLEETNRQLLRAEADARRSERLAALGQLSAGLAHEIRNPLNVIKGSSEMLSQKLQGAPPLAIELAGYIGSEVNRLNSLVSRFLDFARPLTVELRPLQISALVDRSLALVATQFPDSPVQVQRTYAAALPEILADEQLCERVFVNLIVNAYQAMHADPDTPNGADRNTAQNDTRPQNLRVSITRDASGGKPGVLVAFDDTGPGVPFKIREQIFNPFFTSKKDGVGLGLSIVAKIVDDHRGWIRLESNPSGGARFVIFLPENPASSSIAEKSAAGSAL